MAPAIARALDRVSKTKALSLLMKYFIVLNIASPGHRLMTPGTIKTRAGNLKYLAQNSDINDMTKAERKVPI